MPMSNFSNFVGGVSIRGVPLIQTHPGKVVWVYNGTVLDAGHANGSDGNPGTFSKPFATLQGALTALAVGPRSNKGDIVFIKPGHAESVTAAGGIVLSTAGVAIVGLGTGSTRPTFTFTTANTATITVTANNVTVNNLLFLGGFLNVATAFDIANAQVATDFVVDSCEFRDSSAILNFVKCVRVGTTANIADGLTFTNNKVYGVASSPAAGTTAISTSSVIDRLTVTDNVVLHQILLNSTSALVAAGANNLTGLLIARNRTSRPNTTSTGEILSSSSTASTGLICDNTAGVLSANALIAPTGTKLAFSRNFAMITGAADKSALENPAAV